MEKITQCCYCKSNTITHKWISNWYNVREAEFTKIAHGCSNCKNYYEKNITTK